MQIIDTFIVPQSAEFSFEVNASAEDKVKAVSQLITAATQSAAAIVRQQKPLHRTFALSVSPVLVPHADHWLCVMPVIVALVPDETKTAGTTLPWRHPGSVGSTN